MLSGTSCRFSARFCAVTVISSSTGSPVSAACAGCRHARSADARGSARHASWLEGFWAIRLSFRCRARVISSPYTSSTLSCRLSHYGKKSKCRGGGIAIQDGSEGFFQRIQPGLVVTPMVDSLAKNRLTNLLRAGGTHVALGFVKAQASVLERQSAIVK